MRSRTAQTDREHALKRWLVLAAWPPELAELRRLIKRRRPATVTLVARAAGVGLVEAAIGATAAIAEVSPDAVMFIGTAGIYSGRRPDLALAGVVAARRLVLSADGVATGDAYLPPDPTRHAGNHAHPAPDRGGCRTAPGRRGMSARHHVPVPRAWASCHKPATSRTSKPLRSPVLRPRLDCLSRPSWASATPWARPPTRPGSATRPAPQPPPAAQPSKQSSAQQSVARLSPLRKLGIG